LGWWAHQELAAYTPEEQDEWLDAIEEQGWSTQDLRKALRGSHTGESPPRPAALVDRETPTLEVVPDQNIEPDETMMWEMRIIVPRTSNIVKVEEAVRKSAGALEIVLGDLDANPLVTLFVDFDV
jgi:hypothetical protein